MHLFQADSQFQTEPVPVFQQAVSIKPDFLGLRLIDDAPMNLSGYSFRSKGSMALSPSVMVARSLETSGLA